MVEASSISALEQAAGNLDRMLSSWTQSRVAELESAPKSDPREVINYGMHALWRMVAIHKSIEQLKNPPAPKPEVPAPSAQPSSPVVSKTSALRTPHPALRTPHPALRTPHPALRTPHSALRTPHSALDSLTTQHPPLITPSLVPSVPLVPCVPLLPSLNSPEAIAAATNRLSTELTARIEADRVPLSEPDDEQHEDPDQLGLKFLDVITCREKYPGSGKFLNSIRADLINSPP